METWINILASAILSGIVATVLTLWWQDRSHVKQEKIRIFSTMMSKRYDISSEESVEALNMIDVVFYKSLKVRSAWRAFNDATNQPDNDRKEQMISDKHLKLLEVIAEDIGFKDISWENIKQYYYPIGLSNRRQDEAVLRSVQIQVGLAQIKNEKDNKEHSEAVRLDPDEELKNKLIQKAIDDPESIEKFISLVEKLQPGSLSKK